MMQPSFDDLVEYVRAGETDPEMQELLAGNPDGQELLKQARFICKVLHDRYGASGDASNVADADAAFDDQSEALGLEAAMRAPMASDVATSYESASFQNE